MASEVQVFGEVDMRNGKVSSFLPAWYHNVHIDNLSSSIDETERRLEMGQVPQESIHETKMQLKRDRERRDQILASRPKLEGATKDKVAKWREDLGNSISESMFTRTEMKKGLADAHEECRRMMDPCIDVRGDLAGFAKECGIRVSKGKVNREGAAKMWKVASKMLGEISNTAILRRD